MKIRTLNVVLFISIIPLIVSRSLSVHFRDKLIENLNYLRLMKVWVQLKPENIQKCDDLMEQIPDGWRIQTWGGATAIFRLNQEDPFDGKKSIFIHHTNKQGGAALIQEVPIPTTSQMIFSAYVRGTGGIVQIWFGNRKTCEWIKNAAWINIPPSKNWQSFSKNLIVPPNIDLARIWLRTSGNSIMEFDDVYLGTETNPDASINLIVNPGFETDGLTSNPILWWQNHIHSTTTAISFHQKYQKSLSYLNVLDMINGNIISIQERAKQIGTHCVLAPEMTSWLLSKSDQFEKIGGSAAREQIYRLAIQLAPNCPQPYAALAKLYTHSSAYWMAAELYKKASNLAENTPTSGRYSFEEGFLRLRYTGELDLAAIAFQKSIEHNGWEASSWHRGAALFYLGQTLELQGKPEEAKKAYQQILNCKDCIYYYDYARDRITSLASELHSKDEQ